MIHEAALKDTLLALAKQNKANYEAISLLTDEIVALRETVRHLDPTFDDVLGEQRRKHSGAEIRSAAIGLIDAIIRRLKAGEVC
jgi:hypothetical protein